MSPENNRSSAHNEDTPLNEGTPDSEGTPDNEKSPGPSSFASEVGAPAGPISLVRRQEIDEVQRGIELPAADAATRLRSVRAYRDAVFGQYFRDRPAFTLDWPDGLYIPADADFAKYWFVAPPEHHRYRYRWNNTDTGQPAGSSASEKDGRLFSWVNVSGLNPSYIGFAGTGVSLTPQASLSSVTISADIDLVTETRWWYMPGTPAGSAHFSYRGTAYLAGWEIDPVTGQWELLKPFGSRTLFKFSESGQGGSAISSQRQAFTDLAVTLQLQGGHTYALGVAFEAEIAYDCRDRTGHPFKKQPGDDIRLWASIAGTVASITVST